MPCRVFWTEAAANAVVVEADAFKESDVIYQAISSRGHHTDMLQTAELVRRRPSELLCSACSPHRAIEVTDYYCIIYIHVQVHQSSTDAAASLLVTALNEGRDVIMDGTLSWEPFVRQTIAMARSVHRQRYRMGVGYKVAADGTTTEKYWEPVEDDDDDGGEQQGQGRRPVSRARKPYRIELVGIVCDAYLAVVRGIRRAIISGRAVRVNSQLKSHKRFAGAFRKYCDLVDNARLYSTNTVAGAKVRPPVLYMHTHTHTSRFRCSRRLIYSVSCMLSIYIYIYIYIYILRCIAADRVEGQGQPAPGGRGGDRAAGPGEPDQRGGQLRARAVPGRAPHGRRRVGVGRPGGVAGEGVHTAAPQGGHLRQRGVLPVAVVAARPTDLLD